MKIDREALVTRHDPVLTAFNPSMPMQVGNGEFAFGMDPTGLQTFVPFNSMAHWGYHSAPLPPGTKVSDYKGQVWDTHGRPIRYPMFDPEHPAISEWLAGNPHAINLGRIGFILRKMDGTEATQADIQGISQTLNLWRGIVTSRFTLEGQPVTVQTAGHPNQDAVGVHVESPLLEQGRLAVFVDCPGDDSRQFADYVGDAAHPADLKLDHSSPNQADFYRELGPDSYHISMAWSGGELRHPKEGKAPNLTVVSARYGAEGKWLDVTDKARAAVVDGRLALHVSNNLGPDPALGVGKKLEAVYEVDGQRHEVTVEENGDLLVEASPNWRRYKLEPGKDPTFSFSFAFSKKQLRSVPSASSVIAKSQEAWPAYWKSGGAIDLSLSKDPRWVELERRIVLSQYLMKVNEAGSLPPQESGLVNNGWFGRWHMEMVWWHATHWALWNRWPELDKSMGIYDKVLPVAMKRAKSEGYEGARWPKCIGPNLVEWPHVIHSLLLWQQPHPLFFAELDYRAHPTKATLDKWKPVVEACGDFLSSYAFYEAEKKRYVLGPPMVVVSENTDPKITENPTFELGYWRFGLRTAQLWRTRLGLPQNPKWQKVLDELSPLPVQDGRYVLYEGVKDMWTKWNFEHPALTGAFGLLPGDGVDKEVMRKTLDKVMETWNFEHVWGWDFPMMAMCAARLGEPDKAINLLLHPSSGFQFDTLGFATGGPYPYFPANGGLLYAVAMMAAGWDGSGAKAAPGFPSDGQWVVRSEGLSPAP